jgi:hypothetical protein
MIGPDTPVVRDIRLTLILFTVGMTLMKLSHAIDWSWWAVTAPVWIPSLLACILLGLSELMRKA